MKERQQLEEEKGRTGHTKGNVESENKTLERTKELEKLAYKNLKRILMQRMENLKSTKI